ncbi:hypothetical protein NBRC116592_14700 [Colwellia sp. KU-HH00111]
MYQTTNVEQELSFSDIKIELKPSLISLFCIQLIFQMFTLAFIQIMSYFQTHYIHNVLSPRGLSLFSWDMWLMMILFSVTLIGYSILNKTKEFSLYLLLIYPASLILLSLVRDVSILQVMSLSLLSCVTVIKYNCYRLKQLSLSEA